MLTKCKRRTEIKFDRKILRIDPKKHNLFCNYYSLPCIKYLRMDIHRQLICCLIIMNLS